GDGVDHQTDGIVLVLRLAIGSRQIAGRDVDVRLRSEPRRQIRAPVQARVGVGIDLIVRNWSAALVLQPCDLSLRHLVRTELLGVLARDEILNSVHASTDLRAYLVDTTVNEGSETG